MVVPFQACAQYKASFDPRFNIVLSEALDLIMPCRVRLLSFGFFSLLLAHYEMANSFV